MKGKRFRRKTILAAGAAMAGLLAAGAAGTAGYLTGEDSVTNVFTVGKLQIDLKEPEWDPKDGDGKSMCPGYSVYKNPTVKNTGNLKDRGNPCFVRMEVEIQDAQGNPITEDETLELIKSTIRYDNTYSGNFARKGEGTKIVQGRIPGYFLEELQELPMVNPIFALDEKRSGGSRLVFQYKSKEGDGVLKPGEEAVLFTDVVIPAEWTKTQMDRVGDFRLTVSAKAIQASGFASAEAAFEALDEEILKEGEQEKEEGGNHDKE